MKRQKGESVKFDVTTSDDVRSCSSLGASSFVASRLFSLLTSPSTPCCTAQVTLLPSALPRRTVTQISRWPSGASVWVLSEQLMAGKQGHQRHFTSSGRGIGNPPAIRITECWPRTLYEADK